MTAWTPLLDAYEASIAAVEHDLVSDDPAAVARQPWTPPPAPGFAPSPDELVRYRALARRDDVVRHRLAERMRALADGLAETRRQRAAGRAYRRV